jgi:hypothetical protein
VFPRQLVESISKRQEEEVVVVLLETNMTKFAMQMYTLFSIRSLSFCMYLPSFMQRIGAPSCSYSMLWSVLLTSVTIGIFSRNIFSKQS